MHSPPAYRLLTAFKWQSNYAKSFTSWFNEKIVSKNENLTEDQSNNAVTSETEILQGRISGCDASDQSFRDGCQAVVSNRKQEGNPGLEEGRASAWSCNYRHSGSMQRSIFSVSFTTPRQYSTSSEDSTGATNKRSLHKQPPRSWLYKVLPEQAVPYANLMRLDKPIGTWLLAWPCFWSISMAASPGHFPDFYMLSLFGVGALLLRGAGCTVNDLWDKDLDAKVERTQSRPLASGALTTFQGLGLLGAQLLLGLGILLQLNEYSILLGASSLGLVFTYPLMKRITFWPQAYLGLTFNWGALLGYAAIKGYCDWPVVIPLYAGGVCWTLVYDTIYAHQDKVDDLTAGVKSTALYMGKNTKAWLTGFSLGATSLWALSGLMNDAGLIYHCGVAASCSHMLWQIHTVNLDCQKDCMAKFVSNKWLGTLMFSGIVADKLLQ